jgi:6-pyruvoyltetrahydropterin/6-carboxytetrahydropterin synthase
MPSKPQGMGSAILSFSFEAAHRQPEVGGKCFNLHGHTFNVQVTLYNNYWIGGVNPSTGLSVEFSEIKNCIRRWIDTYFDHACLLGAADVLVRPLLEEDCKLFLFGEMRRYFARDGLSTSEVDKKRTYESLPWPSVEAIAFCLGEKLQQCLKTEVGNYVTIESVMVSETETNNFAWSAPINRSEPDHTQALLPGEQVVPALAPFDPTESCG